LGIHDEVEVLVRDYKYGLGAYIGHRDGKHRLGITTFLPYRTASRIVWHELTHVAQLEQLGERGLERRRGQECAQVGLSADAEHRADSRAYRRMPLEREAHDNERRYRHILLTQPYDRALPAPVERVAALVLAR
jgi:hypothetical protein